MQINTLRRCLYVIAACFLPLFTYSQNHSSLINEFLNSETENSSLQTGDIQSWEITDQFTSPHNGVTHVHIRQVHQDIPVYDGVANITIKDGKVLHMADRLQHNLAVRAASPVPSITPVQAINEAAGRLELGASSGLTQLEKKGTHHFIYSKGGISQENIPVRLMYTSGPEGELFLVWDLSVYTLDSEHWWSARIDAHSGMLRDTTDWVSKCNFPTHTAKAHVHKPEIVHSPPVPEMMGLPGEYNVFSYRIESPNHGPRTLEVEPADSTASPFGWHDTDGVAGAEFTITRGNNVYASEDRNADNVPGYSPDGGPNLSFDFPLNLNQAPAGYEDVAITNLFYMNNIMHDLWYQYGFTEAAGNFQSNNYGKGGIGDDYVNADAQDGTGVNNANFGTPPDGGNPRMQMFLWAAGSGIDTLLHVNSPAGISGGYGVSRASFGAAVPSTPLTADIVLIDDGTNPDPFDACEPIINTGTLPGKIALINRGSCTFVFKVEAAQNAGAVAVIIVNNVPGTPITMGGASNNITIPAVMVSLADGNAIRTQIQSGATVNATLVDSTGVNDRDGDFDNGIIAHEYGHGISNRLTGGGSNSGCLNNAEQMGEGWSDWFGLVMNLDTNFIHRGVGTFAIGSSINGVGIRNAQYSNDFTINNYTYDDTNNPNNVSQPHGIGFVWATMLWDLTLAFVDEYGYDPDVYHGTGGNNIFMQLVMDGLMLQPCNPGFVDGRDAILLADQINNGGANQCLIWEKFANRGLGLSASQGSVNSRVDQIEAFDVPPICLTPVLPPTAVFDYALESFCNDVIAFTDKSTDIAQSWYWDFGDGNTDTVQNPVHTFEASGVYTVTLIASNPLGSDTIIKVITISLPPGPVLDDVQACLEDSVLLTVNGTSNYYWYDDNGTLLDTGAVFSVGVLASDTIFYIREIIGGQPTFGGPPDNNFGSGGYHNSGFTGTINFTASTPFILESAWLDAGGAGSRTIYLWSGIDASGPVLDEVTINIPAGPQRVTLNIEIPGPGTYSVGGTNVNLYRNNTGANYPYNIPGFASMISSSATTGPLSFYYYLYDWKVKTPSCKSDLSSLQVTVSDADFTYSQDSLIKEVTFTDQSSGADSWLWYFGDGDSSVMQNPVHIYPGVGFYPVSLTVNGVCTYTDTIEILPSVGLETIDSDLLVSLIPNPATENVWVTLSKATFEEAEVSLYSMEGKRLMQKPILAGNDRVALSLSDLAKGIYLVSIRVGEGSKTMRLQVQ